METSLSLDVPCKINLHLSVGPRRPDGFHDIGSIFLALAWGDRLHFSRSGTDGFWSLCGGEPVAVEDNLVTRALGLFREAGGDPQGLSCRLEKRVPAGSGLGGGSADAAYTLLALNRLSERPLPSDVLMELAACLGSDVPFFLKGPCSWVEGRGERIEVLDCIPDIFVLLVIPPVHSDTRRAFALLDRAREDHLPLRPAPPRDILVAALCDDPRSWPFFNDFYPAFAREPGDPLHCAEILASLKAHGALFAALSGSGAACFGIYPDRLQAERAAVTLSGRAWRCQLAIPLARSTNTVVQ